MSNEVLADCWCRIKSKLRNALLVSKRKMDSQNASDREELFRSNAVSDEKAVSGEKTAYVWVSKSMAL